MFHGIIILDIKNMLKVIMGIGKRFKTKFKLLNHSTRVIRVKIKKKKNKIDTF